MLVYNQQFLTVMRKNNMRYSYQRQSNTKIVFYAVAVALILGVGFVVVQDIQAPTEHISQKISVNLEK